MMSNKQSEMIMKGMIDFIKAHGDEKVDDIIQKTNTDFTVQREKLIFDERKRLYNQYEKDLNIAEINLKISQSAKLNEQRIDKMKQINALVASLEAAAAERLHQRLSENRDEYAELLKNLLI